MGSVLDDSGWVPGSKVGKGDGTTRVMGEGEGVGVGRDVGGGVVEDKDAPINSGVGLGVAVGSEELVSAGGEGLVKGVAGAEGELRDGCAKATDVECSARI
jgi:hypothetical protein